MSVCYFDNNYNKKYKCNYEIKKNTIEVEVEYDIDDEIEAANGVQTFSVNTKYRKRDVLIIDYQNKKNYLLKNTHYAGHSSVYGTPDDGVRTKFRTQIYFEHTDLEKLANLPVMPKVNRIRVYSKAINDLIGYPSLEIKSSQDEYVLNMSRDNQWKSIEINENNVKKIVVSDDWNAVRNSKEHRVTIDLNGYIEIELTKRRNYDLAYEFVYELKLFMQLYYPEKFHVDKMYVMVEGEYYILHMREMDFDFKESHGEKTVKEDLLIFLKKCYTTIPFRNSKTEIRNIPYIIMTTSRSLEDNFLMFYRFIECYYKKQQIPNIKKTFVSYSIKEHYTKRRTLSEDEIEKYSQEIICLRNHYVHSGYFIKNASLRISFDKVNRKKNPKDYTVNNADIEWIYERTMILYKIVVDIIFDKMLGYTDYKFNKHF